MISQIKLLYRSKQFIQEFWKCRNSNIKFYNFWNYASLDDMWFYIYLRDRLKIKDSKKTIAFYSCLNDILFTKIFKADINIFFTGESHSRLGKFNDSFFERMDINLGFKEDDLDNYLRHPLWIHYLFKPESSYDDIKKVLQNIQNTKVDFDKRRFCSHVSSWDPQGIRFKMINHLNTVQVVDCGGKFNNNTNSLKQEFGDRKIDFLANYKFNICPENINEKDYVTEKIFQAFQARTIPIYWGGDKRPESEVLNSDSYIYFDDLISSPVDLDRIINLNTNKEMYMDFMHQSIFKSSAAEYIQDKFEQLDNKLIQLMNNL